MCISIEFWVVTFLEDLGKEPEEGKALVVGASEGYNAREIIFQSNYFLLKISAVWNTLVILGNIQAFPGVWQPRPSLESGNSISSDGEKHQVGLSLRN